MPHEELVEDIDSRSMWGSSVTLADVKSVVDAYMGHVGERSP